MFAPQLLFFVFAGLMIMGALCVISSWDPVRGVLSLIGCFFCASVIWMLLDAEFLSIILILVYVGAVMVLFLFVVMMLHIRPGAWRTHWVRYWPLSILLGSIFVLELVWIFGVGPLPQLFSESTAPRPADFNQIVELGRVLFTDYIYPFEIAGVILWVAIVAAIAISLKGPRQRRVQHTVDQITANKSTHLRMEKGIGAS